MASNQRENKRREKQRKKEEKVKKTVWAVLIVVIVILLGMRIAEIDFADIKNHFTDENGKFTISQSTDTTAYPYNIDSSSDVGVVSVNDKLNIITDTSYTVLNPSNAKVLYTFDHGYANPVLKYAGGYSCLFDQGASRLRLDTNNENIYETNTENSVLTADVAKNGTVIYASATGSSKSTLYVMNKSLEKTMSYTVTDGYVVSVAIDSTGKKYAWAVINSENAQPVTTVYTINAGDEKPIKSFEFKNTYPLDLHYCSSSLYFVGDNCVSVIKSQDKIVNVFKQGSVNTVCYNYNNSGELVYVYSKYSEASNNIAVHVNPSGKFKNTVNLKQKAKYITASSREMCVLFSDKISCYSLNSGELKSTVPCDDTVNSVNKMSSKLFIQKQQIIEEYSEK